MRITVKRSDWFIGNTTETVIGVIAGLIVLYIIVQGIWEKISG
jgi:hypothetical protein